MAEETGPLAFTSPQSEEAQAWLDKVNEIMRPGVDAAIKRSMIRFLDYGGVVMSGGIEGLKLTPGEIVYHDAEFLGRQLRPKGKQWFEPLFAHGVEKQKPDPIHNAIRKTRNA
jgi:hypothetical protein